MSNMGDTPVVKCCEAERCLEQAICEHAALCYVCPNAMFECLEDAGEHQDAHNQSCCN